MFTYKIFYEGNLIKEIANQENDWQIFKTMANIQSHSIHFALQTGYKVEEINEETQEIKNWNPFYNK